ncbi:MAG: glycosyltransferase family 4 protein [Alphaproteobacteria bacterium]|nr:glycosyltransferase family 4 protein [Alphaproteobacteria bacterium]
MAAILLLTGEFPPRYGGIATYSYGLAEAAQRAGHDVTVFAPSAGAEADRTVDAACPFAVERYRQDGPWTVFGPLVPRTWAIVARRRWDIIHAIDTPHARALALINLVRRTPYIATVHGDELMWCRGIRRFVWRALGAYRTAERIVCNSEFTRNLLLANRFVAPTMRTVTSYCGVSAFWFGSEPADADIRAKLALPADRDIVLTVARLDERKGHRLVLAALDRLPDAVKARTCYVVVGAELSAPYASELRLTASAIGLPVIFTGALPDTQVRALYGAARVFCMPNEPHPDRIEGFGQAFLEAGAQGVPSLATRLGGIPEAVLDGQTGLLVPSLDVAALSRALERLLGDPALRDRLGAAARERARLMSFERCMRLTYGFGAAPAGAQENARLA